MVYKNVDQGLFIKLRIKLSLRKIKREKTVMKMEHSNMFHVYLLIFIYFLK